MSGPKSSRYRLSAAQLQAIREEAERQRQEQIRKEKVKAARMQISRLSRNYDRLSNLMQPILNEPFVTDELKEKARIFKEECRNAINQCETDKKSEDPDQLELVVSTMKEIIKRKETECNKICAALPEAIAKERVRIEDAIAEDFGFSLPEPIQQEVDKIPFLRQEINSRLYEISSFNLPEKARLELDKLMKKAESITSLDFLENFLALDIDPFIKRCQICSKMDYTGLRTRYELLAKEHRSVPKEFEYSAKGMDEMKAAAEALEAEILADRERAYIHEALEAAIEEMGYKLIGDRMVVRKKTGKTIKHQLYSLQNGTAVDVTFSDDGQIAMELGGVTHSDRLPTVEESDELVEDMNDFCRDYARLEKILEKRGVQTNKISVMPPAVEYARMINVDHYQLNDSVPEYQMQKTRKQQLKYMKGD